ncbi:hypothetical protein CVT24_011745 [Panaeolus cyanescens]|uniref:Uncharacterized protein n=1 Tax=Panaeolus cyanescens TaxID=181874 RepID=A0A409YNF0_9AGAR|nr:hypothetical protein CVT24_011745 [Panaeolus cyanescens]
MTCTRFFHLAPWDWADADVCVYASYAVTSWELKCTGVECDEFELCNWSPGARGEYAGRAVLEVTGRGGGGHHDDALDGVVKAENERVGQNLDVDEDSPDGNDDEEDEDSADNAEPIPVNCENVLKYPYPHPLDVVDIGCDDDLDRASRRTGLSARLSSSCSTLPTARSPCPSPSTSPPAADSLTPPSPPSSY